jgi:hypothetical protein
MLVVVAMTENIYVYVFEGSDDTTVFSTSMYQTKIDGHVLDC